MPTQLKQNIYVIVPAAGMGARMGGGQNKVLLELAAKPVLRHTLEAFQNLPEVTGIVVVGRDADLSALRLDCAEWGIDKILSVTAGGATRQESVFLGLKALAAQTPPVLEPRPMVLIHDAARCLTDAQVIRNCISGVLQHGACVAAVPVKDTIKIASPGGFVCQTLERGSLWQIQTPQAFYFDAILSAYEQADREGFTGTDDASLAEHAGQKLALVAGSYRNIKLTTQEDLLIAEAFLAHPLSEDQAQAVPVL